MPAGVYVCICVCTFVHACRRARGCLDVCADAQTAVRYYSGFFVVVPARNALWSSALHPPRGYCLLCVPLCVPLAVLVAPPTACAHPSRPTVRTAPPAPTGGAPPPPPPLAVAAALAVSPKGSPARRRLCPCGFRRQRLHPPAFCPPKFCHAGCCGAGVCAGSSGTVRGGQRVPSPRSGLRLGGSAAPAPRRSARPPCLL